MEKARHPKAIWWLAGVSFAESSFFPIPPDVMLVPMVLADRRHAWRIAAVCLISSVLGGMLGYYIGYALLEDSGAVDHLALRHAGGWREFQECTDMACGSS
jgi:membrane protein YqaA with SNARE-associated domain